MFPPITLGRAIKSRLAMEMRTGKFFSNIDVITGVAAIEGLAAGEVVLFVDDLATNASTYTVTEAQLANARIFMTTDDNTELLEFGQRAGWAECTVEDLADDFMYGTLAVLRVIGMEVSLNPVTPGDTRCNEVKQPETGNNQRASTPLAFI
jgi:hypothetical protein